MIDSGLVTACLIYFHVVPVRFCIVIRYARRNELLAYDAYHHTAYMSSVIYKRDLNTRMTTESTLKKVIKFIKELKIS